MTSYNLIYEQIETIDIMDLARHALGHDQA